MVTVIKVKASVGNFFGDGGVNTNKRHWRSEDADEKIDYPTTKRRYHHSESTDRMCHSFMTSNAYLSYADIEAACSDETSSTTSTKYSDNVVMPYTKNMAGTATSVDNNFRAPAVSKRPSVENEAPEFQHYATFSHEYTEEYKKSADIYVPSIPIDTPLDNIQITQQWQHKAAKSSSRKERKVRSAPKKKQKAQHPTKNITSPKPNDPVFNRHVGKVQQIQQLKATTADDTTTEESNDGEVSCGCGYGQRGITLRPSGSWQVQLYYHDKSQYIGVFKSKTTALAAYEMAREILSSEENRCPASAEEAKSNFKAVKRAVLQALCPVKKVRV